MTAFRWTWLVDRRTDVTWYVGSALAGWLYAGLVLLLGRGLARPMEDAVATFTLGGHTFELTLGLLIVASWSLLLDAPHVFGTLARTMLDPDEWRTRRSVLLRSWLFFLVGPAAVLLPYLLGRFLPLSRGVMALGGTVMLIAFQLWAYYHVVRQHWGFVVLYKRKNADLADPLENRVDAWFFNLALYLPLVAFLSAPWYAQTGLPPTGFRVPLVAGLALGDVLGPLCAVLYPALILGYAGFQLHRARAGVPRNGPKLLLLLSVLPLHLAVFSSPLLALFVVPLVTLGHNLQYHRIIWTYGRNKYAKDAEDRYRFAGPLFRGVWRYALAGGLFTLLLYRGPWMEWLKGALNRATAPALGAVTGLEGPAALGVGELVFAWLLLGWAMQHYYLDAKIWRVNRDPQVARALDA